jgi:hypothetical protein
MKNVPNVPQNPYNEIEFEEFLKNIGNSNISTWSILADVLGVDRRTVTRWKKHSLARAAIAKSIKDAIIQMERAGAKDWRMWCEKLKMLGVKDRQTIEQGIEGESISSLLDTLERTNYEEFGKQAQHTLEAFK